jgi:hypothetical protein
MKYLKIIVLLIFTAIFSVKDIYCQELRGLQENAVLKKYLKNHPVSLKSTQTIKNLTLPFFDDFSTSSVIPDQSKWEDKDAFINNSYPVEPISIGVATLDAIDQNGNVYAINAIPTLSDHLTSRPIDLSAYAGTGDSLFISFFYQAGGQGDLPERTDSLTLEFYAANSNKWIHAWSIPGDTLAPFKQVILPLPDSLFQDGFQFRFSNYTSMSVNDVTGGKGALSNVDQWNLDYIQLDNKSRAAFRNLDDIAFVEPLQSTLILYQTIPWTHINNAQFNGKKSIITVVFRNAHDKVVNITRSYLVTNLNTGKTTIPAEGGNEDFPPDSVYERNDYFNAGIINDGSPVGRFQIESYLGTTNSEIKSNDTVRRIEEYSNYYAYDDGTAEYGFGITGESSELAQLAYRFKLYKEDTLSAVDIYFNKTQFNYNSTLPFRLCVWNNRNGEPDSLVYSTDTLYKPSSDVSLNQFKRYSLDTLMVVKDTVYVGLIQIRNDFLNIGYDVNDNNKKNIFINTGGTWYNPSASIKDGSLMIRPVFGKNVFTAIPRVPEPEKNSFIFYPNPASDHISIEIPPDIVDTDWQISIYDISGRSVKKYARFETYINLTDLNDGIYFIRFTNSGKRQVTKKLLIVH